MNQEYYSDSIFQRNKKSIYIVVSVLIVCLAGLAVVFFINGNASDREDYIYNIDYAEHDVLPVYDESSIREDFFTLSDSRGNNCMSIADDALVFLMSDGSPSSENNGGSFSFDIESCREYLINYNVYFEEDFDWNTGGILCGISGGEYPDDGFNVQLSWDSYGSIIPRIFHCEQNNPHGDIYGMAGTFETNRYYQIHMYVKSNTPNECNGVVKIWINGEECFSMKDFCFTTSGVMLDAATVQAYYYKFVDGMSQADHKVKITNYSIIRNPKKLPSSEILTVSNEEYSSNKYNFDFENNVQNEESNISDDTDSNIEETETDSEELLSEDIPESNMNPSAESSQNETEAVIPTEMPVTDNTSTNDEISQSEDEEVQTEEVVVVTSSPESVDSDVQEETESVQENVSEDKVTIKYELIDSWNSGYSARFIITNSSDVKVNKWQITASTKDYDFTSLWNGRYQETGDVYTIIDNEYNATIEPGAYIEVGFCCNGAFNQASEYSFKYE